ncbi:MAG TPA: PH domain-containing protein [Phycisphaerales bacterium]|nr:PH domain-containing protein [Phycisphaerales bacterium]
MSRAAERTTAWVYRGLWGVLVRWLRVPREQPGAPPGSGPVVRSVKPAPGFLRYLKFQFWLLLIVIDVVIIGVWAIIVVASPLAGIITAPLFWGVAIIPDIIAYAALHVRYDTTWYVITDRSVRIRRGVWIIREITITFENVQNVEVRQGPLQRHFGISNVVVQTAGGGATGPHGEGAGSHQGLLEGVENAGELRDLISARARASRGAGLGDEAGEPARRGFGPEHLAALRAISAEVR